MSKETAERERHLNDVKRAVKQLTEEAVTRKFVHEESSIVIALCVEVESALRFGLRRRLFSSPTTLDLIVGRLSPFYPPASHLYQFCTDVVSGKGLKERRRGPKRKNCTLALGRRERSVSERLEGVRERYADRMTALANSSTVRVLWIRLALVENFLGDLLRALVKNSSSFYDSSLVSHPVDGHIFVNLLDGPCAMEYSRMKTADHLWTDPPADELLQRQRMSTMTMTTGSNSPSTPSESSSALEFTLESPLKESHKLAKDHLESLHQTSGATLLFAKNQVCIKPLSSKESVPGYLSLRLCEGQLILKWMPNFVVAADSADLLQERELRWDLALSLDIREIASLHCHLQKDEMEQLQMIGHDGRQFHPMAFPTDTLTTFLACVETGLLPHGSLDPPLWMRHNGRDSIFPTRRRNQHQWKTALQPVDHVITERPCLFTKKPTESYVFHVIHGEGLKVQAHPKEEVLEPCRERESVQSPPMDAVMEEEPSNERRSLDGESSSTVATLLSCSDSLPGCLFVFRQSLQSTCGQMSSKIMSRAFYGWLSHVRYTVFVRKHLSSLVHANGGILPIDKPTDASEGLTQEVFDSVITTGDVLDKKEVMRRVFYGGLQHHLRPTVWPYLLGHYEFDSRAVERVLKDADERTQYEEQLGKWSGLEKLMKKSEARQKAKLILEGRELDDGSIDFSQWSGSEQTSPVASQDSSNTKGGGIGGVVLCSDLLNGHDGDNDLIDSSEKENNITDSNSDGVTETTTLLPPDLTVAEKAILGQNDNVMLENLALNLHRIDKDVMRCDRNLEYFMDTNNLQKLKNILGTFIWVHRLAGGYVQGMCDILAPLLVVLDDESLAYCCFVNLMKRLDGNFGSGKEINANFSNLKTLLRVMDHELYELLKEKEVTHFYFAHRWFLVDFKREFDYSEDGVFLVWETLWTADHACSSQFQLFVALALLETYRDIILDREMGFSELVKFFNEMSEQHRAQDVLKKARQLVLSLHAAL
eukprot:m.81528 g.81528  ORF g.81528 m.81528 type:complete len:991 (+) comp36237_c0_seq28:527-3499(+)